MDNLISTILLTGFLLLPSASPEAKIAVPVVEKSAVLASKSEVLARESLDMTKRNPDKAVSDIFRDNILLNLHYMYGDVEKVKIESTNNSNEYVDINWDKVREPLNFSLVLEPGELLAFHDELLPEFRNLKVKSGWTKFSVAEGYKVLDGLSGNGVCHLATLINWVSSEAGLGVTAKVNHDFYPVPGIDRKYGTSIIYLPGEITTQMQNLYVINNTGKQVKFVFKADYYKVELSILKNQ